MIQEGITVLIIGMCTVVAFLLFLVATIYLMGRFVAKFIPPSPTTTRFSISGGDETLAVAIAAARRARD